MPNPPELYHGATKSILRDRKLEAYYSPLLDRPVLPRREAFDSLEFYYSVLFHELTHSTGAKSRLNRETLTQALHFGDTTNYSREELVAEMGALFLAGHTGIEQVTLENSAAYLANWIRVLKGDPRFVISAAANAQKTVDYILKRN
jgi:antirestriction protein ArdC